MKEVWHKLTSEIEEEVLTRAHFLVQRSGKPPWGDKRLAASRRPSDGYRFRSYKGIFGQSSRKTTWVIFKSDISITNGATTGLRYRWKNPGRQLDEGELVLIKENGHHALDRRSGRVLEVYPDSKGIMRQVWLKTAGRDNIH